MKKARDDKPIITIPDGAYESGNMHQELRKSKKTSLNDIATDAQGNGYPTDNSSNGSGN